ACSCGVFVTPLALTGALLPYATLSRALTRICPKRQVARRPDTPRLTAYHGQRQAPRRVSAFTLAQLELGARARVTAVAGAGALADRKSPRLDSSHVQSSYAVFCVQKNR